MKYFYKAVLLSFIFLFTACSTKESLNINKNLVSFSLNEEVVVYDVPKTVDSPISIGLGLGGYVFKHVGIHVGTRVTPKIKNSEALNLKRALALHNISLQTMIKDEFKKQMRSDSFYNNKFVPFGADYVVTLAVPKYTVDTSIINSKDAIKTHIELSLRNKLGEVIYSTVAVNDNIREYSQQEMYSDKQKFLKALNTSISNTISKLVLNMKKN